MNDKMIGKTISHYKILEKLGGGGMGVVYKAEDIKLNRTVALKFLPPTFSLDDELKQRFIIEAQAASSFDHPNICNIHEISETDDGQLFIVMAHYDGETLKKKIDRGVLPIDEVINIISQVAQGLLRAQEKEIIHRDIKPANIFITNRNEVKILDFGLAKIADRSKLTRSGTTTGTVAYMSPEQARSEEVNRRTDIWSLGVVLYEMISGKLPFGAEYEQATLYSILNEDPEPLTATRTGVPMELERITMKCLMKETKRRYQHFDDLIVDLEGVNLINESDHKATTTSITKKLKTKPVISSQKRSALWIRALIGIVLITIGIFIQRQCQSNNERLIWSIPLEMGNWSKNYEWPTMALSPDGRTLIYRGGTTEETSRLFVRHLNESETREIAGTIDAAYPFFSPDGKWVAFTSGGELKKVLLSGGEPISIVSSGIVDLPGVDWASDDFIYYVPDFLKGIYRVSANGGEPEQIVEINRAGGESGFSSPSLLPDGESILCTVWGNGFEITIINLKTGKRTLLFSGGIRPHYISGGYIVFAQGNRLMAMTFNEKTLERGNPVPVVDNLLTAYYYQSAQYANSESGTLTHLTGESEWDSDLIFLGFDGSRKVLFQDLGAFGTLEISPDGNMISMGLLKPTVDSDIYIYDIISKELLQRTSASGFESTPLWTPDGSSIIYLAQSSGQSYIILQSIKDNTKEDTIFTYPGALYIRSLTKDGRLFLDLYNSNTNSDIWRINLNEPTEAEPFLVTSAEEVRPSISTDGKFLAYSSDESGIDELYVIQTDLKGKRIRISSGGGSRPRWSSDSNYLYYWSGGNILRVERLVSDRFSQPRVMLENVSTTWDLHPDGNGIIARSIPENPSAILTINWIDRLKQQVPPTK
jgi:serine/threonine-protein kinase